ncbi:MAG: radical SAM protein [Firmicutes bacterium HGW-Firmicutes-1]|jgi:DNA repair photolyase|nr:MAG: radical SAM protein [Firmicutes bacterium HGW-Firmicutes-1]
MSNHVEYITMNVQSALKELKRKVPYGWDLNIYRGCQHGCEYCYAMYSHEYLGANSFSEEIYVKENIVDELEKELKVEGWKREIVNIGGVTDSYQPAEAIYKLMPAILRLLIKYKTPAIISTKSSLILRDFDLIDELSRLTYINIAATIITSDEELCALLEPGADSCVNRFKVLEEFRKTNASIGMHVMPIIPFVTDSPENLESIYSSAASVKVDYVLPGTLYLRGATRKCFFEFIENKLPDQLNDLKALYKTGGAGVEYKNQLYSTVNQLKEKYGISSSYTKAMRDKMK